MPKEKALDELDDAYAKGREEGRLAGIREAGVRIRELYGTCDHRTALDKIIQWCDKEAGSPEVSPAEPAPE